MKVELNTFVPMMAQRPARGSNLNRDTVFLKHIQDAKSRVQTSKTVTPTAGLLEGVMAAADPKVARRAQASLEALAGQGHRNDPMIKLEGALMTKYVDLMMPKASKSLYGDGVAGETWRSFAVDQFGSAIAQSDPLKLASERDVQALGNSEATPGMFANAGPVASAGQAITPFSN